MAQVKGPLLSERARGKFGGVLVFSERMGEAQVNIIERHRDRKTFMQQYWRSKFKRGMMAWDALPWWTKYYWINRAYKEAYEYNDPFSAEAHRRGRCLFMHHYMTDTL